ncbi:putative Peptidyl-prolyl cis-trans isomerase (cyclophilin) [Leptomonas pyrrhocoris]|uniref:Putative Peptidyl-prolyl cis-trans isomerase (Cyclophilin) n=1 Tax=Leptomonas pyrrhocoris TaxID=157538 RepID=A0A0M9GAR2_LEPPY|nr:putative Peptidyl-prolyl cis-trans isomerase (cyclophilin) [Leptomonas pyrrhocoris]XP_015664861.1 putative Peptidyl-prolyl cis-trans isomerase (cyclophilin) [Leptomonas pyrrhocoris]XP_015664862.1 putative Peptidyl-prolyl cis-trans isomerase (cyclophilin) [Leptomonas pyrrhocoris]KPA86421.1 putative Peptidyl-prolyl cis-trans isomerase (cyclophilin) [Leptomonas pyrrhocoris]KPA86422.1 putative Peptidyl-prolyl cis-trans isomerase (cyclophilin) [Leptomonas pyrrhocoris]KPA86423.1 putative Peptidyl|eukprot:XP_015664860.1 putative Peptidyl-prolyl cis-trans isomerase (cyclophilin) [Leptomonas pyrrhocoris]
MAVVLHTTSGDLPVLLHYQTCPLACFNFLALCASGYYDGCHFYRHFPRILLQTGDPTNSGKGGESIFARLPPPSAASSSDGAQGSENTVVSSVEAAGITTSRYFRDEGFGETTHTRRGVLSMAHRGTKADTNASQFFITTSPQPSFDGVYTAFGVVDLQGVYDAASATVVEATLTTAEEQEGEESTTHAGTNEGDARTGDAVLHALEEAAAAVDTKNFVRNAAGVRITGATVLYNPFAEGKVKL